MLAPVCFTDQRLWRQSVARAWELNEPRLELRQHSHGDGAATSPCSVAVAARNESKQRATWAAWSRVPVGPSLNQGANIFHKKGSF